MSEKTTNRLKKEKGQKKTTNRLKHTDGIKMPTF